MKSKADIVALFDEQNTLDKEVMGLFGEARKLDFYDVKGPYGWNLFLKDDEFLAISNENVRKGYVVHGRYSDLDSVISDLEIMASDGVMYNLCGNPGDRTMLSITFAISILGSSTRVTAVTSMFLAGALLFPVIGRAYDVWSTRNLSDQALTYAYGRDAVPAIKEQYALLESS